MSRASFHFRTDRPEPLFLAAGWVALGGSLLAMVSWIVEIPGLHWLAIHTLPPVPTATTWLWLTGMLASGIALLRTPTYDRPAGPSRWVPVLLFSAGASSTLLVREGVRAWLLRETQDPGAALVAEIIAVLGLAASAAIAWCGRLLGQRERVRREAEQQHAAATRLEGRVASTESRLNLTLQATSVAFYEWDVLLDEFHYSPSLHQILGYAPSAVGPRPGDWSALIHPEDLPAYTLAVGRQLAGLEAVIEPEYRVRTARGDWCWLHARALIELRDDQQRAARIVGTLRDVTARRAAEDALRASQATTRKLSFVASRTDNLVLICSQAGTIEWVNDSFTRVMEYPLEEIRGRNPATFMIGPETSARTVRQIRSTMARGEGHSCDLVNYTKSGRKYHLHLEIQPVRNETGEVETFIAILADITARVETEQALRRAKSEADAASRAKSEFLASMSHEIRTPMNGVIGMTSLLLDTGLTQQQREFVNTVRTSSEHLLGIINDILDFSKIESGHMDLDHLPFELATCIEETLDLLSDEAGGKKLELAYVIEPGVPAWITGDISRLRQVLVNLVNNAVKFTPGGCVDITVRPLPEAAVRTGRQMLEFVVQDTGIGIAEEQFGRLFQPFSQLDASHARRYGGAGLGLAICHRLCALMGGVFRVESTPGKGSRFIFTIQTEAARAPAGTALPPTPEPLRDRAILCVEDNPVTVRRLELLFQQWSVTFVAASSPAQALTLLDGDFHPAVVLLDVALLAGEAGSSLGARFATLPIPVLMLQPAGQAPAQTPFPFGRIATLGKPLRTVAIVRSLQMLLQIPPDPAVAEAEAVVARTLGEEIPLSVLLVEDNPVNQKVALRFLEQLGYRADAVGNGLEALASVSARDYQLVLMDLQMPEMDGFEASRQIRRMLPAERQPRIVALTANALQGDRQLCFDAGMDDYITKPLKSHDLAGAIRRQFGAQQSSIPA